MTPGVTGLVVTRNAGRTLDPSLRSLASWVDELLVVDMASEDDTREIARRHGARILDHEPVGYADPARGFGVAAAANEWIMMLDADEVIPGSLSRRLRDIGRHRRRLGALLATSRHKTKVTTSSSGGATSCSVTLSSTGLSVRESTATQGSSRRTPLF